MRSSWVNVLAAVVGGIALGVGVGRLILGVGLGGAVWTVLGVVILWWAFLDRRKWRRGTPESEVDGSHTVE